MSARPAAPAPGTAPGATTRDATTAPAGQVGMIATPEAAGAERSATRRTQLIAVISMPLFFLITFTLCYVSASHAPRPHDMAITLAGPTAVTQQVANGFEERAEGAFEVTRTTSTEQARADVAGREAAGALVVDGTDVTAVVASGGGRLATGVVQDAADQVAGELGGTVTVEDLAPLPGDDPGGSVLFFFLVACTVGPFLSITAISQVLPAAGLRPKLLTALGAAVVVPVLSFSVISLFVDFGVTFATATAMIGIGMIYALTIGLLATLLQTLLGGASIFGVILFLIALNFPSSGGSVPGSMLPAFWQLFHGVWVGAGAFEAIRSVAFFGGEGAGRWMLQLAIWTIASALLLALVAVAKRRRAAAAEVREDPEPDTDAEEGSQTAEEGGTSDRQARAGAVVVG